MISIIDSLRDYTYMYNINITKIMNTMQEALNKPLTKEERINKIKETMKL